MPYFHCFFIKWPKKQLTRYYFTEIKSENEEEVGEVISGVHCYMDTKHVCIHDICRTEAFEIGYGEERT